MFFKSNSNHISSPSLSRESLSQQFLIKSSSRKVIDQIPHWSQLLPLPHQRRLPRKIISMSTWIFCKCSNCYLRTRQLHLHHRQPSTLPRTRHRRAPQRRLRARAFRLGRASISRRRRNSLRFKVRKRAPKSSQRIALIDSMGLIILRPSALAALALPRLFSFIH